jgi:hypothetical protein
MAVSDDRPVVAPVVGFHCAHELWSPRALLDLLKRAERAGVTAASCSDHFMPWSKRDGQSGFAWSWLGAALEATSMSLGTVCAPTHIGTASRPPSALADLPTPWAFDAATAGAALDDIRGKLRVSSSIQQHVDWLLADVELGFRHLYLHNVDRDQERFIDACGSRLIPAVVAGAR